MFGKRALQVSVVKTPLTTTPDSGTENTLDPEQLAELAQDVALNSALAIGAVIVTVKVVTAVCDIAKIIVKANLR
jgi:hypothetical protein